MARAVGDVDVQWVADAQLTFTSLASLASSSTLLAGAESAAYTFSALDNVEDAFISGQVTVGASNMTANTRLELWVAAPINDTPTWPDTLDGTDSAETLTSAGVKNSGLKLAATITFDGTDAGRVYPIAPVAMAGLFGGALPEKIVAFVTHNGAQALAASGNEVTITPVFRNAKLS